VDEDEVPLLIDTTIPNTAAALQVADVVISVLDARDPLSYRSTYVEGTLSNTPLLYVLNKIGEHDDMRLVVNSYIV
jgi:nuclear GTP-binding protein